MDTRQFSGLKDITAEEFKNLEQVTNGMTEKQFQQFYMFYSGKRKTGQDVLLFTLLGFICVAGVQRFVLGQIGMGILYILTGGLCLIGTIVDLINHRRMAENYNRHVSYDTASMVKMMYPEAPKAADTL